jgi:small-conductance mechanosensitive channel
MAWKRSSVRSRSGPPIFSSVLQFPGGFGAFPRLCNPDAGFDRPTGVHPAAIVLDPNVTRIFSTGWRDVLYHAFFKIGALPITVLFLIKAALFFFLLMVAAKFVQRVLLTRVFHRLNISDGQKFALGRFTTYLLFFGGLFVGLQTLGLNLSSLLVFGGALGVGIGLGLQNVVSNFVAGLILLIEQPIRMGDRVQTGNTLGDVVKIGARSTWIRSNDNVVIIVPNNEFINNSVTNWTANDPTVRVNLAVGVGYNSEPAKVRTLLLAAAAAHQDVLKDPAPDVIFTEYGDNSLNFMLRVWTSSKAHATASLKSDLYFMLFDTFSAEKIELPFPQRDLHVRSFDVPVTVLRGKEETKGGS